MSIVQKLLLLAPDGFIDLAVEGGLHVGREDGDALLRLDFALDLLSRGVLLGQTDESNILGPRFDLTARLLALSDLLLTEAKLVLVFNHFVLFDTAIIIFLRVFFLLNALSFLLLLVLLMLLARLLLVASTTGVNTFGARVITTGCFSLTFKSIAVDEVFIFFEDATFRANVFIFMLLVQVTAHTDNLTLVDVTLNEDLDVVAIVSDQETLILDLNVKNILSVFVFGHIELDEVPFVAVVLNDLSLLVLNRHGSTVNMNGVDGLVLLAGGSEDEKSSVGKNDLHFTVFTLTRIDDDGEIGFFDVVADSDVLVLSLQTLEGNSDIVEGPEIVATNDAFRRRAFVAHNSPHLLTDGPHGSGAKGLGPLKVTEVKNFVVGSADGQVSLTHTRITFADDKFTFDLLGIGFFSIVGV